MSFVDPQQFVITRKRKKYKFALFANSPLCFEYDEWQAEARPVDVVEVGAGTGLFSVELAVRHPEQRFMALDVKGDRLQKGACEAAARDISNIVFVRARADQLPELVAPQSLSTVWLTFSDPFPRRHSRGRRLTHPHFLQQYGRPLLPNGRLLLKHDSLNFFCWSLEQLIAERWRVTELSFNLHESDLADDYKIKTTYEQRWLEEGRYVQFAAMAPPLAGDITASPLTAVDDR